MPAKVVSLIFANISGDEEHREIARRVELQVAD
jgi:hypothetical protein